MRATLLFVILSSLFSLGASCGQNNRSESETPDPEEAAQNEAETPSETPSSGTASADAVPMPSIPDAPPQVAPDERTAPPITDLASARTALAQGFYEEVQAALPRLGDTPEAELFQARLLLATGRYRDAAAKAQQAARGSTRVAAFTLKGEALMRAGEYDDAARAFGEVRSETSAHRARVLLGRLYNRQGRGADAEPVLMDVIQAYNDETIGSRDAEGLAYVAMAAWELGSARDANDAFQESTAADGDRTETQLEWAALFFAKYDTGHAEESIREVLRVNPNHPEAHAWMARIRIDQAFDFAGAEEHIERALEVNPNLVMAHVTRAGMALRDLDITGADEHLDRALQVNPNDLEALSVRAAVRYLAEDEEGFRRAKQEVLRRHRTYSEMYNIIGEFAEWEHRYPDIVAMSREAVTLNSDDYRAHAALGLNLLRMGDEDAAMRALNDAWDRDRFNVRVYNTLHLYEDIIPDYEELTEGPFVFRMHEDERPMLTRYIPPTLRRAYDDMRRRYDFTPEGPIRIELFSNPQHFALRTTGLPALGVQGVCFGKVVTAISPRGGPFNWGQITWHELAHVFHIQLSQNRVPRWFTEGLAEYETLIARTEWKREMDHHLWQALANDELPPLRLMNRAFTHARSPMDMMVAYYASTKIVEHIANEHGFPDVVRMLREWGQGRRSPDVVQRALGISIDELDEQFRTATRRRLQARATDFMVDFSRYGDLEAAEQAAQAAPQDADAQAALAASQLVNGDPEAAQQTAQQAIQLAAGNPIARYLLARLALSQQDGAGAQQHLQAIVDGGRDGYEIRLLMARAALGGGNQDAAKTALQAATRIDPERPEAWQGLAEIAAESNDDDLRLNALTHICDIDEHDRASHRDLVTRLVAARRWDDALVYAQRLPFVDPHDAESHRLYAEVLVEKGRHRDALRELESALIAEPSNAAPVHLLRVRAFRGLDQTRQAREAASEATRADPSVEARAQELLTQ